jgi:hypothetical protein
VSYQQEVYQPRRILAAGVYARWQFVHYAVESSGLLRKELFDSGETPGEIGREDAREILHD